MQRTPRDGGVRRHVAERAAVFFARGFAGARLFFAAAAGASDASGAGAFAADFFFAAGLRPLAAGTCWTASASSATGAIGVLTTPIASRSAGGAPERPRPRPAPRGPMP